MKFKLQYFGLDCHLAKNSIEIFMGLHEATNGDPCTTGCTWFDGGKCQEYQRVTNLSAHAGQRRTEITHKTNQEIANELGISKRQVSKLRKQAKLNQMILRENE